MPKDGVYADTSKNRALGRVGQPYARPGSSAGGKKDGDEKAGNGSGGAAKTPTPTGHRPGDTRRKKGEVMSVEEVDRRLEALGVDPKKLKADKYGSYEVSKCVRAAIQKGYIQLKGEDKEELNQVVFKGTFEESCGEAVDVKLCDVLYQPDYAGTDYEDGMENATVICQQEDDEGNPCEEGRMYLTRICTGKPSPDSGKFHNHCGACPGFGVCIGDYREAHCDECGRHYWAGLMGGRCDRCHPSGEDSDEDEDSDEY